MYLEYYWPAAHGASSVRQTDCGTLLYIPVKQNRVVVFVLEVSRMSLSNTPTTCHCKKVFNITQKVKPTTGS